MRNITKVNSKTTIVSNDFLVKLLELAATVDDKYEIDLAIYHEMKR